MAKEWPGQVPGQGKYFNMLGSSTKPRQEEFRGEFPSNGSGNSQDNGQGMGNILLRTPVETVQFPHQRFQDKLLYWEQRQSNGQSMARAMAKKKPVFYQGIRDFKIDSSIRKATRHRPLRWQTEQWPRQ